MVVLEDEVEKVVKPLVRIVVASLVAVDEAVSLLLGCSSKLRLENCSCCAIGTVRAWKRKQRLSVVREDRGKEL